MMLDVRSQLKALLSGDQKLRTEILKKAIEKLEVGERLNKNCASLYFYKGIMNLAIRNVSQSILNVEKAIEKSEDNIPGYFYVKGLAYGTQKMFKQAINDFTITINLDNKHHMAYLNRAKCYHLLNDRNSAFLDLQKYIQIKPNDVDIHLWAGNLLFNIGAFEDAIKAYSNITHSEKAQQVYKLRIGCFIILKELNNALNDMQKIIDATKDTAMVYDRECLNSLRLAASQNSPTQDEYYVNTGGFNQAIQKLKKLKSSPTQGTIFKTHDRNFYLGMFYFYAKNYEKAVKKFNQSIDFIKNINSKSKVENSNETDPDDLEDCYQAIDEFEFENQTYNIYEFQYNVSLCYLMMQKYDDAIKLFQILQDMITDQANKDKLSTFIGYIQQEVASEISIVDQATTADGNKPDATEAIRIEIFPCHNRLCSIFPLVRFPLKKLKLEGRLSFCLPRVSPPSMVPCFEDELLK